MKLLRRCAFALLGVGLMSAAAAAQDDPQALVARMVHNELNAGNQKIYWMYVDSKRDGTGTEVTRVIETPECWLTWPVSNSGDESAEEQQREKLEDMVKNPSECRKQRTEVNQDDRKADALLTILPNVFLYSVESRTDGKVVLKFRPNPKFDPPTREAKVFHNMAGTLTINEKEARLAELNGTLMSDVTFGLGVLAKLHKGGTFKVVKSEVAPHDWELTLLDVHINGRALFFKTISEQQHETKSDFQRVPAGISLTEAAAMVKRDNPSTSASAEHGQ